MEHPQALAKEKRSGPVVLFARNQLCALVKPGFKVDTETAARPDARPQVKLGTSTPTTIRPAITPGRSFTRLTRSSRAPSPPWTRRRCKLVGGPASLPPRRGAASSQLLGEGKADIFLTYCTNAMDAVRENADSNRSACRTNCGCRRLWPHGHERRLRPAYNLRCSSSPPTASARSPNTASPRLLCRNRDLFRPRSTRKFRRRNASVNLHERSFKQQSRP